MTAPKKAAPKPPARPPSPIEARRSALRAAEERLKAERLHLAAVTQAIALVRTPFKAFPEFAQLFVDELRAGVRPDPPDGGAIKAAITAVRTGVIDRLHAMIDAGTIDLDNDDRAEGAVQITVGELLTLLKGMFPDDFKDGLPAPPPTAAVPGSDAKIEVMAARVEAGQAIFAAGDADLAGAVIVERKNGSGKKVIGVRGKAEGGTGPG